MESHAHQCPDGVVLCKYSEVGCCEKVCMTLQYTMTNRVLQTEKCFVTSKESLEIQVKTRCFSDIFLNV